MSRNLRALLQLGLMAVVVLTLVAVVVQLSNRDHNLLERQKIEEAIVQKLAVEVSAPLLQSQHTVAELAAWMAETFPKRAVPDGAEISTNYALEAHDAQLLGAFDAMYEHFATALEDSKRSGLIYFGTEPGSLLVAGRYPTASGFTGDLGTHFCDVVFAVNREAQTGGPLRVESPADAAARTKVAFTAGDYHEFFVPREQRARAVSTFLDRLQFQATETDGASIALEGTPLAVHFQILQSSRGRRPWVNQSGTPRPDLLGSFHPDAPPPLADRLARKVQEMGRDEQPIYHAKNRPWYTAATTDHPAGGTRSYGLFEYFNGLDWGVSALRRVELRLPSGPVHGVLAVDLARDHLRRLLAGTLDSVRELGPRRPLAAVLLAPAVAPSFAGVESGAVPGPGAGRQAGDASDATAEGQPSRAPRPAALQTIVTLSTDALRLGVKPADFEASIVETVERTMQTTRDWRMEQKLEGLVAHPDSAAPLESDARLTSLPLLADQLPWKIGLVFPQDGAVLVPFAENPFRWWESQTRIHGLVWPIAALLAATYLFIRLRTDGDQLQISLKRTQEDTDRIRRLEVEKIAAALRWEETLEREKNSLSKEHDQRERRSLAEQNRRHALELKKERARQESALQAERTEHEKAMKREKDHRSGIADKAFNWIHSTLNTFQHDVSYRLIQPVDYEVLSRFIDGEWLLAKALVNQMQVKPEPELFTTAELRKWLKNPPDVQIGPEIAVDTQRHTALRILFHLVENARAYRDGGSPVSCLLERKQWHGPIPPTPPAPEPPPAAEAAEEAPADRAALPPASPSSQDAVPRGLHSLRSRLWRHLWPRVPEASVPASEPVAPPKEESPAAPLPEIPPPPPVPEPARGPSDLKPGWYLVARVHNHSRAVRRLSAAQREELFVLFGERAKRHGVGLYRHRQLAELMGGRLLLEDGEDKHEIIFTLWLPAEPPDAPRPVRESAKPPAHPLPSIILDDLPAHLDQAAREMGGLGPVTPCSEPAACVAACVAAVEPATAIVFVDYHLGKATSAEFPHGLAVAAAVRARDFHGLLVLHSGQEPPADLGEKLRTHHMYFIPKGGPGSLIAQLPQLLRDWIHQAAPPWRAEDLARLRTEATACGISLLPADTSELPSLIKTHVTDPIFRAELLRLCETRESNILEKLLGSAPMPAETP